MPPLSLTDAELDIVMNAAAPLPPKDHSAFLVALAIELGRDRQLGRASFIAPVAIFSGNFSIDLNGKAGLRLFCPGCQQQYEIDLRKVVRAQDFPIMGLRAAMVCESMCRGDGPEPQLLGLERLPFDHNKHTAAKRTLMAMPRVPINGEATIARFPAGTSARKDRVLKPKEKRAARPKAAGLILGMREQAFGAR